METAFFYAVIVFNTFFVANGLDEGPSIRTSTPTVLNTKDGEIAHFTCTSRGHSLPSVTWEKGETKLGDDNPGVVIISWKNGTTMESHLLVAVTCDDRRGNYTCVASSEDGEKRQKFVIEDSRATKELKDIDYIAIGVGIGITLSMFTAIVFFLIRGSRRLREGTLERTPRCVVNGRDNEAVEEETANADFALQGRNTQSLPKIPELRSG
ncbi:uncharacterized protein LOC144649356 [Oculina patagonica]